MGLKIKCPSCGRIFEIPDSQKRRSLRCMCKHIFAAAEALVDESTDPASSDSELPVSLMSAVSEPDQIPSEAIASDLIKTTDEEFRGQMSEDEISDHLEKLRESAIKVKIQEKSQKEVIVTRPLAPATIEVDDSRMKPKQTDEPREIDEDTSEIIAETQAINEMIFQKAQARPPAPAARTTSGQQGDEFSFQKMKTNPGARSARPGPKETPRSKLWVWIAASSSAFILLIGGVLFFRPQKEEEEAVDPYLKQLLTPRGQRAPQSSESTTKNAEKKHAPAIQAESTKTPSAAPSKNEALAPPKQAETLYDEMYESSLLGEFENVIRLSQKKSQLTNAEKALDLEAQVHRAARDQTRLREIIRLIDQELRNRSKDPSVLRAMAFALLELSHHEEKHLDQSMRILSSLSLTKQEDAWVFAHLGEAYSRSGQPKLAEMNWDQALTLEKTFPWLLDRRLKIYLQNNDHPRAEKIAERMTESLSYASDGYLALARISVRKGDPTRAIRHLRQGLKQAFSSDLQIELGNLLLESNPQAALKEFEVAVSDKITMTTHRREALIGLAHAQCKTKQYDAAWSSYGKALAANGRSMEALIGRGRCASRAQQWKRAESAYSEALKVSTQNHLIWLSYGQALSENQKLKASQAALEQSIALKATDAAHYSLALVLKKMGRKPDAIKHAKQARALNPQNKDILKLLAQLQ